MNIRANPSRLIALAIAPVALALSACGNTPTPPAPLEGTPIGGEFALTNSAGETVRFSDFEGKYRIVYFGYAFCPDICPTDVQRTIQGLDQFAQSEPENAAKVQPIFISVDPERDTPEVIDQFTHAFSDDLIGLTGTHEQLKEVITQFAGSYTVPEHGEDDSYLVDHTRNVILFGPQGEPIALLPADEGAEAVAAELAIWVS